MRDRSSHESAERSAHASILLVTNMYPSAAAPKFGSFVRDAVSAMEREGVRIDVVASADARGGRHAPAKYAGLALATVQAALRGGYDSVQAHYLFPTGWIASFAARLRGVPLTVYSHGSDVRLAHARWPVGALTRRVARTADLVFVPSEAHASLVTEVLGVPRSRMAVVPIGVDTTAFPPGDRATARRSLGWGSDERHLLFAGALDANKGEGVEDILGALADERLGDVRLVVVGEGPREGRLRELAARPPLRDRVEFRASMSREALAELIRAVDVVVVPSRRESLGLVALEARALGTPVVATAVGGLPEHVEPGVSGELYEPGDIAALAEALVRVFEGSERGGYRPDFDEDRFGLSGTGRHLAEWTDRVVAERRKR